MVKVAEARRDRGRAFCSKGSDGKYDSIAFLVSATNPVPVQDTRYAFHACSPCSRELVARIYSRLSEDDDTCHTHQKFIAGSDISGVDSYNAPCCCCGVPAYVAGM